MAFDVRVARLILTKVVFVEGAFRVGVLARARARAGVGGDSA